MMGTSWSRARSTESSLSATPAAGSRFSSAGVTSTIPIRDFAKPLSIARRKRLAEANVFLAKPDRDIACHEQIAQLRGDPLPVVPRVAQKDVPKVRQGRALLDGVADWRERPYFLGRVKLRRTGSRPAWFCAAAGPAAAPAAAAAPRRGVRRRALRRIPIAAVAAVAATATACGAVRRSARRAMAESWCCASSHVADATDAVSLGKCISPSACVVIGYREMTVV